MTEQPQPQFAPPPLPPPKRNRTNLFAVLGLVAILVVAGVVAIVVTSGGDDAPANTKPAAASADEKLATERDAAIDAGEEAAETLSSLDSDTVEADLDRWESVSTGRLLADIKSSRAAAVQSARETPTKAVGTVLAAAVAEFDAKQGTARLLVATSVEVSQQGGEPTKKQLRMSMTVKKTADGWKAEWTTQA